jgi:hypothetical protein
LCPRDGSRKARKSKKGDGSCSCFFHKIGLLILAFILFVVFYKLLFSEGKFIAFVEFIKYAYNAKQQNDLSLA